jgi:hypothetical protein
VEIIGGQTLLLGDCLDVLASLVGDCFLTDPFYGVDGGKGGQARERGKAKYTQGEFDDTPESVAQIVVPVIARLAEACRRGAVTPGIACMSLYPRPADIGTFWTPAAMGVGPWGFTSFHPIMYYGRDYRAGLGAWPTGRQVTEQSQKNGHPCPKPLEAWKWLLQKVSQEGESVIDPFMGSGTTLVACQYLGRRGIGVEICEEYFEIACRRVEWAVKGLKEPKADGPEDATQASLFSD